MKFLKKIISIAISFIVFGGSKLHSVDVIKVSKENEIEYLHR